MMPGIERKCTWYIPLVMTVVIFGVLLNGGRGYSEVPQKVEGGKTVVQLYEIRGHLTAINLKERWALIDGYKWELSGNFNQKGLPSGWIKQGNYECKNKWIVVRYYVSLKIQAEVSLTIGEKTKRGIRKIINAEDIRELFKRGGKISRIEVLPA